MSVAIPIDEDCLVAVERYVIDGLAITAWDKELMLQVYNWLFLVTHMFFWPVSIDESILRPSPLSKSKWKDEGKTEEMKKYVAWNFHFNLHFINLPEDQVGLYISELETIQKKQAIK